MHADGQAQLDDGGEAANNSRAKRAAKNLDLAIYLAVRKAFQLQTGSYH